MYVALESMLCPCCGQLIYRDYQTGPGKLFWCDQCGKYIKEGGKIMDERIIEAAREVQQYVENAMADLAEVSIDNLDDKWAVRAAKLKKKGTSRRVIMDIIADEMYNDPEILHDLAGDQIYDHAVMIAGRGKSDEEKREIRRQIIEALYPMVHTQFKKGLDMLKDKGV